MDVLSIFDTHLNDTRLRKHGYEYLSIDLHEARLDLSHEPSCGRCGQLPCSEPEFANSYSKHLPEKRCGFALVRQFLLNRFRYHSIDSCSRVFKSLLRIKHTVIEISLLNQLVTWVGIKLEKLYLYALSVQCTGTKLFDLAVRKRYVQSLDLDLQNFFTCFNQCCGSEVCVALHCISFHTPPSAFFQLPNSHSRHRHRYRFLQP